MSQHPDVDGMHEHVRGKLAESASRYAWTRRVQFGEEFHAVCVNGAQTIAGF